MAGEISDDFRRRHPGIPWRDIIGWRVVLVHHYLTVDPGQVGAIAATEVPRLVQDLRSAGTSAGDRNWTKRTEGSNRTDRRIHE